ncbi:MAG: hypothetical protein ACLQJR_17395 [Stellaceae bacterium]
MTIPYPPLFDDIRQNHGFVDVRGRPDLAAQIAEGSQSSAMKSLLIRLAQPRSKLFTVGCDLAIKFQEDDREYPHTAGGYIQIMNSSYARRTPEDYARFAQAVAERLRANCADHYWQVRFLLKPVRFKLDTFTDMTGSLWIWFHAFADAEQKALASREALILELRNSLTNEDHVALFEGMAPEP